MSLHQDIKAQMIEAMKAREAVRLSVIRGLLSSFTNEAIAKKRRPDEELSDEDVMSVISRAVKQRKDSIEQYEKGGRPELAADERAELTILETYLPTQMSHEEVFAYVKEKAAAGFDLSTMLEASKKGQFMGMIMKELKGKADGTLVKEAIDNLSK